MKTAFAQQMVRHKTRKKLFTSQLTRVIFLQVIELCALAIALIVTGSPETFGTNRYFDRTEGRHGFYTR